MKKSRFDNFTRKATYWIGTPQCLMVHVALLFAASILVPFLGFQTVLLITTTILSWEAIFIGIFIQMAVNRQHTRIRGIESDIDDILEDTEQLTEEDTAL